MSWLGIAVFLVMSASVPVALLVVARLMRVRPARASALKLHTYECGEEPTGPAWIQFHPRYFIVALFFVLFDVEVAFLFPWAVALRAVGVSGLIAAGVFVGILMLGWWYCVARGTLRWR